MPVFDYEDIQLVPNKCIVKSRSEIDTRIKFGPMTPHQHNQPSLQKPYKRS